MVGSKPKETRKDGENGVFATKAKEIPLQEKRKDILRGITSGNDKSRTIWIYRSAEESTEALQTALPKEKQVDITLIEEYLHCPKRYYFLKTDRSRSMQKRSIETTFDKAVSFAVKQMMKYYAAGRSVTAKTGIALMYEMTKTLSNNPRYDHYYTEASKKIVSFANNPFPKNTDVVDAYFTVNTMLDNGYAVASGMDALLLYRNTLLATYVYYKHIPWYASNGASNRSTLMLNAAKFISKSGDTYKYHLHTAVGLIDIYNGALIIFNTKSSIQATLHTLEDTVYKMSNTKLERRVSELCATCKYRNRCFGGGYYEG